MAGNGKAPTNQRDDALNSWQRLASARLYILSDATEHSSVLAQRVKQLVDGGVDVLQLRDKRLHDAELVDRARTIREITKSSSTLFIMNDRADLALLAEADGVHLGQEEVGVQDARRILGPHRLIGVSTHSLDQAQRAVLDGANYIGVGPVFPSTTKSFKCFPGLELLRMVARESNFPAFAIGGICRKNLPDVIAAGFSRVAISRGILDANNPAAEVKALRQMLHEARKDRRPKTEDQ